MIICRHYLVILGFACLVSFSSSARAKCVNTDGKVNPVIVLGLVLDEDSSPKQELVDRIDKALEISRGLRNPCFILSGKGPREKTESAVMAELLKTRGVSIDDIIEEPESISTEENAVFSKNILQKLDYDTPTLVTTSYHMPRARYYFEKVIGPVNAVESLNPTTMSSQALERTKYIDTAVIFFLETRVFNKDTMPDILSHEIRGQRRAFRDKVTAMIDANDATTTQLKHLIDRRDKNAVVDLVWPRRP